MQDRQGENVKDRVGAYLKRAENLASRRATWSSHWQELAEYCLQRRATFDRQVTPGSKNMEKVFDSTAIWAAEQAASMIYGGMMGPSINWFKLLPRDSRLYDDYKARVWLEQAEQVLYRIFSSPHSMFAGQSTEVCLDLVVFGTAILYVEEVPEWPYVRFSARHLGECFVAEGKSGRIDTLYRRFKMPARVAHQTWGDRCGPAVLKQLEKDKDQELEFLHCVQPREEREYGKVDAINKPFQSLYISVTDKWLLSEGGYDRFPYLVPRWSKMVGEIYGRSPAMTALPDVKMINAMSKVIIRGAQKAVDPPLMVPHDDFFLPVKTGPGSINFYHPGSTDRIESLEFKGRIDIGDNQMEQRRQAILRAFYLDQMKLQKEKLEMTRYEAETRNQENMRAMSPTVGRLETELLSPVIEDTFAIAQERGLFPEPPQILSEAELKIEYVSPIARAQKSGEAGAFAQAMQLGIQLATVRPDALDSLNFDEAFRRMPDWYGLPQALLQPKAEVERQRKQREQQAQFAQMSAAAKDAASAAKDGAQALGGLGLTPGGA